MARERRIHGALVEDVALPVGDADPVEAYVVSPGSGAGPRPAGGSARAGVIWLHWLGEHRNDRSQFLAEAAALAARGVRSVLPAGRLPWLVAPRAADQDVAAIELEGRRLDAALATLVDRLPPEAPIALVGHDFGAMHGLGLLARAPRIRAAVLIAGVPRWADWFRPFWPIETEEIEYRAALLPHDPVRLIAKTEAELLLQFSRNDFYIPQFWGRELARATGRDVALEFYAADHAMRSARARASRTAFLEARLGLG